MTVAPLCPAGGVLPTSATFPSASVEGSFHPRVARISGSDCFGRPMRPNGVGVHLARLLASQRKANASRLPFVTDCLSYAPAAELSQPAGAIGGAA